MAEGTAAASAATSVSIHPQPFDWNASHVTSAESLHS